MNSYQQPLPDQRDDYKLLPYLSTGYKIVAYDNYKFTIFDRFDLSTSFELPISEFYSFDYVSFANVRFDDMTIKLSMYNNMLYWYTNNKKYH